MIYCFAGPTLAPSNYTAFPQVKFLPPIKAGDLNDLIINSNNQVSYIVIIDGLYHSSLSIRHKEIIAAISRGIKVYGAGSIGALRAAELKGYGMIGHGEVFNYYANNLITSDDEVSVVHSPFSPYTSFSVPIINLRLSIPSLIRKDLISESQSSKLLSFYESLHYTDRTKSALINYLKKVELDPLLIDHIKDYKLQDTIEILSSLNTLTNKITEDKIKPGIDNRIDLGYYFENFFTDQKFPSDNSSDNRTRIDDFKPILDPVSSHHVAYNSLNRQASLLLCRSLDINVLPSEVNAMKKFLNYLLSKNSTAKSNYSPLIKDPVFLDTISTEESLLLKLHIFLIERMGKSMATRQRHFWLSSYFNSSVISSSTDVICQLEFSEQVQTLISNFSSNKSLFQNFL